MAKSQPGSPLGLRLAPPYERLWHARTHLFGGPSAVFNSVLGLHDAKYLLLESERPDGTWVGTSMWVAAVNDTIFLRSEAKARRISRRPIVKVAACTMRGKPLDDQIECLVRIVPQEHETQAEAALRRSYDPLRDLIRNFGRDGHLYLELTPIASKERYIPRDAALPCDESSPARIGTQPNGTSPDAA
jgi:PPOX class probable F420-dependent enzyme